MSPLTAWSAAAAALAGLGAVFVRGRFLLHMFQLEEYDGRRFILWAGEHRERLAANWGLDALAAEAVVVLAVFPAASPARVIFYGLATIFGIAGIFRERRILQKNPVKKPLVMTARARRLMACTMILAACMTSLQFFMLNRVVVSVSFLIPFLAPLVLLAGNLVVSPVESAIRAWYVHDAQRVISQYKPIIIGITGSYGKTSTKFFTAHLLEAQYHTLMTPESYNTTLGICRVIRGQLGPEHEVFVVELAENEKGGFKRLLNLVPCAISAVTSVGLQHLEEFGSREAIQNTMRKFIAMPESGATVVLNADDATLSDIHNAAGKNVIRTSAAGCADAVLRAEHVQMNVDGLSFEIVSSTGERIPCKTMILGRHNVQNILIAAAIARELHMSWETIQNRIATLQAPPHRLKMLQSLGGTRVIDDAFNSNPSGFAMAMEVLASFPARRILVTPGLVSLGSAEEAENTEAGRRAASAADVVVLVGPKKTAPIREGLLSAGFPEKNITTVHSLDEVKRFMQTFVISGDTILFENDLPDTYNE